MRYAFTLILSGQQDPTHPEPFTALESTCDDALFGVRDGVPFADFDREGATIGDVVHSAITDVERSSFTVVRVESDEYSSTRCDCGAMVGNWNPTHVVGGDEVVLCENDVMEPEYGDGSPVPADLVGSVGAYRIHEWHSYSHWPQIRRTVDGRWLRDMGNRLDDETRHVLVASPEHR